MAQEGLPFEGLKVLDVSSFIAAPAAATILGDFGADVIKVEPPEGDPFRNFHTSHGVPKHPVNFCWEMASRNKRSIAIDLKSEAGYEIFQRLVRQADIMIINYPPAVRARLRLTHADVAPLNERLIYASLTGYGETGPDVDQPGYDATAYFARSGLIDATTYEGAPPAFSAPGTGDHPTATALFAAIMAALWRRERTGKGAEVGTSLLANGWWANGIVGQAALLDAYLPPRPPRTRPRSALVNQYLTKDGRWISLALAREEKLWPPFAHAIGRPELIEDPRFIDTPARRANGATLAAILDPIFASRTLAEWEAVLKEANITYGVINRLQDASRDPQAVAAGAIRESANPALPRTIANPLRFNFADQRPAAPAPGLGEHTDAILREIGVSPAEITSLRARGVVA
jgi:crotonobetainyl-CoA:carnitine CoA-transferase CaiB-like acyl-CoA transferase